MTPTLLFLCGGRRVGLLHAFRRALDDRVGGRIYTTDTEPRAASSFVADGSFPVGACDDVERFAGEVADVCLRTAITAVIPLRCDASAAFPALRRRTTALLVGGDDAAIHICNDKVRTAAYFRAAGLFTPEMVEAPSEHDLPLFCRPRASEGSKGAFAVLTAAQLALAPHDGHVFTRYVDGTEYSLDCYKDLQGRLLAVTPRQRLRVRAGEVERAATRRLPHLCAQVRAALEPLGFIGPATVQAIVADGQTFFTEINLRYGGGVTLSIAAGVDSPRWLVQELSGERRDPPCEARWNLGMSRYDAEFYYQEGDR